MIWKTVRDEQLLRYEIGLFEKWFSLIFTQLISDQLPNTTIHLQYDVFNVISQPTNGLTIQSILKVEQLARKMIDKKTKLLKAREKLENKTDFDHIIIFIENRLTNMIQRAQCNSKQIVKKTTIITKFYNATFIKRHSLLFLHSFRVSPNYYLFDQSFVQLNENLIRKEVVFIIHIDLGLLDRRSDLSICLVQKIL